jgi:hypothetical protein
MLINFVLGLFAIYLLLGLVVLFAGLFFLGSLAYSIHKDEKRNKHLINKG